MTDNQFPFGAEQAEAFADDDTPGPGGRRALLVGGALASLVLAGGAFFLLGGETEEEFAPVQRGVAPVAATSPAPTAAVLPAPFDEALGRDPFRALYVEPGDAPAAAETSSGDPTLPQSGPAVPAVVAPGAPAAGPGSTTPSGSPSTDGGTVSAPVAAPDPATGPTAQEHALVLRRVYGEGKDLTAEFTIDGRKTLAKVGVRFGPTDEIRLISLQQGPAASQWTAVLQVGDGEPFDAVTGDEISVR